MNNLGIIKTLQAEIEALKTRVRVLEYECLTAEVPEPITAQQIRDEIVEKAKRDIAYLGIGVVKVTVKSVTGVGMVDNVNCTVEFVVNKEKRTVVALLRGYCSNSVRAKGIAKCGPSDCFNVHIGRAIALRRALGLTVPDSYLNAPQPEEVRVGDVVEWYDSSSFYKIIGKEGYAYKFKDVADGWESSYLDYENLTDYVKVIDDSRE